MKDYIDARTVKDQVYQILKEEILMGALAPGEKLIEQSIADRLHVSRSPVREAIKQLTGDGLVVSPPNKGARVRTLSERELNNYFDVRVMYEVYASKRALGNLAPAVRSELEELCEAFSQVAHSKNIRDYQRLDWELHSTLIRLSDNELIQDNYSNLYVLLNNYFLISGGGEIDMATGAQSHRAILNALLDSNATALEQLLIRHLEAGRKIALSSVRFPGGISQKLTG